MKIKVNKSVVGIKGHEPYIAFSVPGKEHDRIKDYHGKDLRGYVIDIYKPKRSNEANAYMWVLINEIADRAGMTPNDVYRHAVKEAGKYDDLDMAVEALDPFTKAWKSNGIAWLVESEQHDERAWVRVYYGSSAYNSKEMSRLVNHVVDVANEWGIETMPPEELKRLKGMAK